MASSPPSTEEEVKVLEVCRVAPISATATASASLPFTFFDALWLRFPPTQRLFFYQTPPLSHDTDTRTFLKTILVPRLKYSLSITLNHYFPLAGKLVWRPDADRPIILYTEGDAVSLTIADSGADFDRLSGYGFCQASEFHPLLPNLVATDTEVPVIALQVTLFGDRGFSIGYVAHHAALDGKSAAMFIHSWAFLCRIKGNESSTLKPEFTPCYNRTIVEDPTNLEKIFLSIWLERVGPNNKSLKMWEMPAPSSVTRGTFLLNRKNIEHVKNTVIARWQEKQQQVVTHVSTFTATVAYTWSCLAKAKELSNEEVRLVFTFDCRARLEPPLPSAYFGNCVLIRVVNMVLSELVGEDGVSNAAEAIGGEIEGLNKDGVLKDAETVVPRVFSYVLEGMAFESIAGSPLFGLYGADFGWGKPKKVEMASTDKSGAFSLAESGDGNGGVEIGIVLPEPQLEVFASIFAVGLEGH